MYAFLQDRFSPRIEWAKLRLSFKKLKLFMPEVIVRVPQNASRMDFSQPSLADSSFEGGSALNQTRLPLCLEGYIRSSVIKGVDHRYVVYPNEEDDVVHEDYVKAFMSWWQKTLYERMQIQKAMYRQPRTWERNMQHGKLQFPQKACCHRRKDT